MNHIRCTFNILVAIQWEDKKKESFLHFPLASLLWSTMVHLTHLRFTALADWWINLCVLTERGWTFIARHIVPLKMCQYRDTVIIIFHHSNISTKNTHNLDWDFFCMICWIEQPLYHQNFWKGRLWFGTMRLQKVCVCIFSVITPDFSLILCSRHLTEHVDWEDHVHNSLQTSWHIALVWSQVSLHGEYEGPVCQAGLLMRRRAAALLTGNRSHRARSHSLPQGLHWFTKHYLKPVYTKNSYTGQMQSEEGSAQNSLTAIELLALLHWNPANETLIWLRQTDFSVCCSSWKEHVSYIPLKPY